MEIKSLAYTESLKSEMFILNSTNHKMRSFITSRERKLFMQLHKALCKLLWVSHKAPVTHSQEQVQRGTGGQTGARASPRRRRALPSAGPAHTEHRERREGKFSIYPACAVGPLELLAHRNRRFYHRHQDWKSSDRGRVILLTWSFLWITDSVRAGRWTWCF